MKNGIALLYSFQQRRNRFGKIFREQLEELQRNRSLSFEERTRDQFQRLKALLIYVRDNVPYYHDLFQSIGFSPESFQKFEDLRQIPLLDKETVRTEKDRLISKAKLGPIIHTHTSGTTGKALHLLLTREASQRAYACVWFHYTWAGIQRGDRIATFAGHPVARPESLKPPFWIYDPLENEMFFSSYHITPATLPFYVKALAQFRPVLIRGYPSSIYLLAMYLLQTGRDDIRPKAVFTSSETLFDFQRKAIEQAFGCKVYSYYGNTERVAHLLECQERNFHVITESCVIEILRPDGSPASFGECGELVCTGLFDRAMPLIRYRVGDMGIFSPDRCPCGINTPILKTITGRVEDVVVTPDGRHVGRLDHAFKDTLTVKEAQIVQEKLDSILVNIVPREGFGPEDEKRILRELRLRLGEAIQIQIQKVERIPRTETGKFRFVISKVPMELGSNKQ